MANLIKWYWWNKRYVKIGKLCHSGTILVLANKSGLISLANHLLNLAQDKIENGVHIHLDEYNSLEDDSVDLIIEKMV